MPSLLPAVPTSLMQRPLSTASPLPQEPVAPVDLAAVLAGARTLQNEAGAGPTHDALRGKKIGIFCETNDAPDAVLFRGAALELGAHVAHLRPSLSALSTPQEVHDTARMLGRLYDAVECQGMAPDLVRQIGIDAGVPVYDGLASAQHSTSRLVEQLDGDGTRADKRRVVLQAMLLATLT